MWIVWNVSAMIVGVSWLWSLFLPFPEARRLWGEERADRFWGATLVGDIIIGAAILVGGLPGYDTDQLPSFHLTIIFGILTLLNIAVAVCLKLIGRSHSETPSNPNM